MSTKSSLSPRDDSIPDLPPQHKACSALVRLPVLKVDLIPKLPPASKIDWSKRLGSWGQSVKAEESWDSDDPVLMTAALRGTGQNFCIYNVNTEGEWTDFLKLLDEIRGSDFKIFAAMQSPTTNATLNRWFGSEGPPAEPTGYDYSRWEADRAFILKWLDAWKRCAETLSALSCCNPNLVGMLIDDFTQIESADHPQCLFGDKLSHDEVKAIADACKSVNSEFGLWPCMATTALGRVVGKGYILGANYGLKIFTGQFMAVNLTFSVKAGANTFFPAYVTFFHRATDNDVATKLMKSVLLDGVELEPPEAFSTNQTVQFKELSLGKLTEGEHTLTLKLSATAQTNSLDEGTFWRIWGVSLQLCELTVDWDCCGLGPTPKIVFGYRPATLTASYETDPGYSATPSSSSYYAPAAGGMGFTPAYPDKGIPADPAGGISNEEARGWDCAASLPDSDELGHSLGRLVAAPNDRYLIGDIIAGVAPYTGRTAFEGPADAFDVAYEGLFTTIKAELPRAAKLMVVHWAMYTEGAVDVAIVCTWITKDAGIADYTALWSYPLSLYYLPSKRGIFKEPVATGGATFKAFFPGRQSGLAGWYQRWASNVGILTLDGEDLTIVVKNTERDVGFFKKRIYDDFAGGSTVLDKDIGESVEDEVTVTVDKKKQIAMSFDLIGGVGNLPTSLTFTLTDEDGAAVPATSFDYQTGVDSWVQDVYDAIKSVFWEIRKP
jgi:hypothetical protein